MVRPLIAASVSSISPASWCESVWMQTGTSYRSATVSAVSTTVGIAGRVLVDLEAARAHLQIALDGRRVGRAAPPEQLDVERERLPRFEQAVEVVGRIDAEIRDVAVAHPDDGGGARRERGGDQAGGREVDVAIDDAGRRDHALAHDPAGIGAGDDGDVVGDVGVAGPPDG